MQAAGYKQLIEYLDGKLSLPEAIEKIKQAHRNYAKRQLTWLKKNRDVVWIDKNSDARKKIQEFLSKN
jgi:tRNA dimethylallyltransferase